MGMPQRRVQTTIIGDECPRQVGEESDKPMVDGWRTPQHDDAQIHH